MGSFTYYVTPRHGQEQETEFSKFPGFLFRHYSSHFRRSSKNENAGIASNVRRNATKMAILTRHPHTPLVNKFASENQKI